MLGPIFSQLAIGLLAGAVAPLLVPGRRNMPMVVTIVLGILGSFIGGILSYLLIGKDAGAGSSAQLAWIAGAIIGAVIALLLFIAFGRRPTTKAQPGSRQQGPPRDHHVNTRSKPGPGP